MRTQSRATEPSHRVQGRGQDKDKRRTRPGHRAGPQSCCILGGQEGDKAQPQSPATELTEFRGAATRRTTEDKAQPQSPATELTESRGAAKRRTRPRRGAMMQEMRVPSRYKQGLKV